MEMDTYQFTVDTKLFRELGELLVGRESIALAELIKNAYDAMPNGGRLEIKSKTSNETIEINLCDSGPGIPIEVIQKLWKGPVTTKAKGLGLGLAISKRIVEAHNGSICVERSSECGTLVRVKLPIEPHTGGE